MGYITRNNKAVGIDDMALYVPSLYFDIKDLAEARGIEYAKLNKGLGLTHMAIPDAHEDAATMAANAIAKLIDKNNIDPNTVGRIYMGTESALDGAKPTATYALAMLEQKYANEYGENCFNHCDVIDMTFACVGGVDALHNTLEWASNGNGRIGIVVTSDNAKYELASTGEYTQGAGSIAILVKEEPRLMTINDVWGIGTKSVHDFFKPKRVVKKDAIIKEVFDLIAHKNGDLSHIINKLHDTLEVNGILDGNDKVITLHKDTPVFDGQYSNQCYIDRVSEAYSHFRGQVEETKGLSEDKSMLDGWSRMAFHLPYAFHAKRIFTSIFVQELKAANLWDKFQEQLELKEPSAADFETDKEFGKAYNYFLKGVSKTPEYRSLVAEKMEKGQRASSHIGNMYACSIFLALMSTFESDLKDNSEIEGTTFGLLGYGSGSKSKVFEGVIQSGWKEVVQGFSIFNDLNERKPIDYNTYEALHTGSIKDSVLAPSSEFVLSEVGQEGVTEGARYYKWI